MKLTYGQKVTAARMQRQGATLREIAVALNVGFEQVSLYLYGGIDDFEPRIGTAAAAQPAMEEPGETEATRPRETASDAIVPADEPRPTDPAPAPYASSAPPEKAAVVVQGAGVSSLANGSGKEEGSDETDS